MGATESVMNLILVLILVCSHGSQDRAEQATPRVLAGPSSFSHSIVSALRAVTPAVHESVVDNVAMFLLTSETPFKRINNKYIKHAFKTVGVIRSRMRSISGRQVLTRPTAC